MKTMKQIIFLLLIASGLMATLQAQAKIWRVKNFCTAVADFTTAQAAHDGASAGDTIYFESSLISYGDLTCTKKLILVGTGYFLNENPETQSKVLPATLNNVTFSNGSANSCIMGFIITSKVDISSSNIKVTRNHCISFFEIFDYASSIIISDNYLLGDLMIRDYCSDILVLNNIFPGPAAHFNYVTSEMNSSCIILNNHFVDGGCIWGMGVYNSQIHNNIMTGGYFQGNNNIYTHNIGSGDQFGTANNNQSNIADSLLFVCTTSCPGYSTDGKWQLKAGSPAVGAGWGGADCGAFGGDVPYVLSGLPNIPAIYYYGNACIGNQLNVDLKVKSHN